MLKKIFPLIIFIFFSPLIKNSLGQNVRDSLKSVINNGKEDTNKVNALIALSLELENTKPDTSVLLGILALQSAKDQMWEMGVGKSYHQLGKANWLNGDFSSSLYHYYKALAVWEKLDGAVYTEFAIKGFQHKTLGNIGIVYLDQGNNSKALNYCFKALKMAEELGDKNSIAYNYSNIGIIYSEQGDYSKALNYYKRALKADQELGNEKEIAVTLGNIGTLYYELKDYPLALNYYIKVLKVAEQWGNKNEISMWLGNIGLLYDEQGDYAKALDFYLRALKIAEEYGGKDIIAFQLGNIGSLYVDTEQFKEAEVYLKRALLFDYEIGALKHTMQDELYLSELYTKTNRPALALKHYKNHILARDSVYNEENTKKSLRSEIKYEFEKKEALQKAEHENKVLAFEAENIIQKQLRFFLFLVIGLAFLVLFFVNRAFVNKKKHAKFLAAEDNRKELLLEEVHHRINNNLQIISSLLSLQANSANNEQLFDYLQQSQNRIQSLAALHELLYQDKTTLEINMNEYINKVLAFHRDVAGTLNAKVELKTNVPIVNFPTATAVPLALVINELVTNSIKYAFTDKKEGEINITLFPLESEKWKLTVADNGKGLPLEEQKRKNSLGLRLVNILTKQIGATVNTLSSPGATYEIVFKITTKS
ncbi:MAG: tetratricopeptide repeat protein [Bacteroidota bacterium]|nr:tetratricopeptide repeat protein [Bacteroidota bacterium]